MLTIFTPTYNRAHTLKRTYEWMRKQTCKEFIWLIVDDGSTDNTKELATQWQAVPDNGFVLQYVWKPNGGLHTGYNKAIELCETELIMCIDSDDYMPEDAVETIIDTWEKRGTPQYAGILGLDYYSDTQTPIGGMFPDDMDECFFPYLDSRNIHKGDTKQVMRTDLMKKVAPQISFPGEKNFNPSYMLVEVLDEYPILVINKNLCFVEYQENDSMSNGIFQQYVNSPRSFAQLRIQQMTLKHNSFANKIRHSIHYVSSCIIAREKNWLKNTPLKVLTIAVAPLGALLFLYIKFKTRNISLS